jgi:tRNA threonylcarbamoyladenosine biosynthesis protein TsaE
VRGHWDSLAPDATLALGRALGGLLEPGDLVALFGELGSGKTVLVRGVAAGFGCRPEEVHSPTFALVNEYACPGRGAAATQRRLAHFDLYRIQSDAELPEIGWDAYVGADLVLVEWAERAGTFLPPDRLEVRLTPAGAQHRQIGAAATGPRSRRVLRAWDAAVRGSR